MDPELSTQGVFIDNFLTTTTLDNEVLAAMSSVTYKMRFLEVSNSDTYRLSSKNEDILLAIRNKVPDRYASAHQ